MRRALCVGIDNYKFGSLAGCVNDAKKMRSILQRHQNNTPNFDCKLLLAPLGCKDDIVTRRSLRESLELLFKEPADLVLLHFSGHGTVNNLDGFVVTQDATSYDEGVAMSDILKQANDSKATEIIILLDCCFSGNLGNIPVVDNSKAQLREGVSILTASRGDQPSVEENGGGIFTSLVCDALDGGAADLLGEVTAPAIYAFVEAALGAWDQRPLFKSHVSRLTSLRQCTPPIERSIIQNIPMLFPVPAEDISLDPGFEKTSTCPNALKCAIFCQLQALNRVHLVTPIGAEHMYDAAMQSLSCRLTPTGRYYWRLANSGRV